MKYLLDTSVCVQLLRGDAATAERLAKVSSADAVLSAMTVAELRYGVLRGRSSSRTRVLLDDFLAAFEILPFDERCAELHASVRHALAGVGTPIGERDLVIAATALSQELVVATGNVRELGRVAELCVEEWG